MSDTPDLHVLKSAADAAAALAEDAHTVVAAHEAAVALHTERTTDAKAALAEAKTAAKSADKAADDAAAAYAKATGPGSVVAAQAGAATGSGA